MHGLAATGGNFTLKSNDKAPRYETNNPASSCTNKLIGDSCALCVSNAHLKKGLKGGGPNGKIDCALSVVEVY